MMPKPRPRGARPGVVPPPRRSGWFGKRRNRRVRLTGALALPSASGLVRGLGRGLRKRARLGMVLVVVLATAAAATGAEQYLTRSQHFAIRALRFSPTKHVSAESLSARAGVAIGSNLFAADLDEIARVVAQEPWVQSARARRELPSTLVVDVVEREAAGLVALGPLYLADARGAVFKRASPDEAASAQPVVTGVERDAYLEDPERAQAQIRDALAAAAEWRKARERPPLGEVHLDRLLGVTVYTTSAVGVRLGRVDETLPARLERFDAVWAALAARGERPRIIYLDNRARPDRVTVRLATVERTQSEKNN
jgi:cell division protein FtsQ